MSRYNIFNPCYRTPNPEKWRNKKVWRAIQKKHSHLEWRKRRLWRAATLKVGDIIEDCSYRHLPIATIKPTRNGSPFIIDYHITTRGGGNCSFKSCGVVIIKRV